MKPIPEFPDYSITEDGRVWSNKGRGRWLKPGTVTGGYFQVTLHKDGKQFYHLVHRLVLETYVGPCPEGMEACHNNGNPSDNRIENLRWDTRQGNAQDKNLHGTHNRGERCGTSKLTERVVKDIRELYKTGNYLQKELGETYGVATSQISLIVNNKRWQHMGE